MTPIPLLHPITRLIVGGAQENTIGQFVSALTADLLDPDRWDVDGVTGLLVPPRDPQALVDAILRLLRDPDLRDRMGQAGRARVERHFSVERMVRETEALYEELVRGKRGKANCQSG